MAGKNEVERIQDQLERAFAGNAWHGPAVFDVLAAVSSNQAASRPIASAHSIWELVLHIEAWMLIAIRRSSGEPVGEITDEIDWPPVPEETSEQAWAAAIEGLNQTYLEMQTLMSWLEDSDLDSKVTGMLRQYSIYEELHGAIQHSLYHLGQIAILAKAARGGRG